jgi:hypothetical protein
VNRLSWQVRRRAAPIALWTGAALIVGALGVHWFAVRPLEARVEALQSQRKGPREGQLDRLGEELQRRGSTSEQLASFYAYFARDEQLAEQLARVHGIAEGLGLEIKRADYRMSSTPERKLDRYQMVVPVQGSYPVVRSFITAVLRDSPTLSIEQVQFQRKDIAVDAVDTQISFTLYLAK